MHPTLTRVRRLRELSLLPELPFEQVHLGALQIGSSRSMYSVDIREL